jgi:hypothetical protein
MSLTVQERELRPSNPDECRGFALELSSQAGVRHPALDFGLEADAVFPSATLNLTSSISHRIKILSWVPMQLETISVDLPMSETFVRFDVYILLRRHFSIFYRRDSLPTP